MILELVLIYVQRISAFLPLAFSKCPNYFMILPLVLIKFKPMPIFCHCFPSNCTTYFSISVGLQSLFRIFQQLTLGVHLFFPLPGLVFISVFFRSLSHQLSSLCHCFFAFYVQPCSFCSSPVILLALSLYGLYCDILFHQFWSCVIVFFVGLIMLYIYIYLSLSLCSCPPQVVFCFKEIRNLPHEDHQTCDAKSLYQFWQCKCHVALKTNTWTISAGKNVCYAYRVCALPRNHTAPCHKRG